MAIVSKTSVTIIVRIWIFMLIFCFAGCAAGSCLSYGHSCWGAHGKRSGGQANTNVYLLPTKTMTSDVQQDAPSYAKEQWILSRLIARRPLTALSEKYRGKWNSLPKVKTIIPRQLASDEHNAHVITDEDVRVHSNNDVSNENEKKNINNIEEIVRSITDERKEMPSILLMSRDDNDQHDPKPGNIELFKLLSNANDNFE